MDPVMVGKQSFTLLFPDLLRPLSADERTRLRDSIQARGKVVVPVVVDEHDGVIDGGNRVILAAELGLAEVPVDVHPGLTQEQKRDLALSLNEDRRHLSPEDRRELALRLRQEGKSYREIGDRLGIGKSTAQRDLQDAGGKSLPPDPASDEEAKESAASGVPFGTPETVRGRDGKQYPAQRTPAPELPDPSDETEDEEVEAETESANARDDQGPVTPLFAAQPSPRHPHSDRIVRWLNHVAGETHVINEEFGGIQTLLSEPEGWDWREVRESVLPLLEALRLTIDEFHREIATHATVKGHGQALPGVG
jgi:ParB-like chromosome segregation protein Spo0J